MQLIQSLVIFDSDVHHFVGVQREGCGAPLPGLQQCNYFTPWLYLILMSTVSWVCSARAVALLDGAHAAMQQVRRCSSAHQGAPGRGCEAATRPQGTAPEDVGLEAALELLRERAKRPPSARSRRARTGSTKQAPEQATADAGGEAAGGRVAGAVSQAPRARKRGKAGGEGGGESAGGARAGADAPAAGGAERKTPAAAGRGARAGGAAAKGAARKVAKRAAAKPAKPVRGGASRAADAGAGAGKRPLSAYLRFCARLPAAPPARRGARPAAAGGARCRPLVAEWPSPHMAAALLCGNSPSTLMQCYLRNVMQCCLSGLQPGAWQVRLDCLSLPCGPRVATALERVGSGHKHAVWGQSAGAS